ncbi:TPA: MobA/MobL family protein [Bacillus cereus]
MQKEKIFHLTVRNFSRSKGHNAIQKASYRTGLKIKDEKRCKIFNYEAKGRKENIESVMLLPSGSSEKFKDESFFYNEIERVEKRKDARLFKEAEIALYREFTPEENKELGKEFGTYIRDKYNVPVNVNFHKLDSNNPHAHICIGLRGIEGEQFSKKKNRDLDKKEFVQEIRQEWEGLSNSYFRKKNLNLFVSHKSYKDRGINKKSQVHLNKHYVLSNDKQDDIDYNKQVKKHNRRVELKIHKRSVEQNTAQEKEFVAVIRSSKITDRRGGGDLPQPQMTVAKLYNIEIDKQTSVYGERKKSIAEKKKSEKEKRQQVKNQRKFFKQKKEKHQSVMHHKKNDLQDLKLNQQMLKTELKGYSRFNPFNLKERRAIKKKVVQNQILQKKKRLEMKREKQRMKHHKKQLKAKKNELRKERVDICKLYQKQAITKMKTLKLAKEKRKAKDLNKSVGNVVSLKEHKKNNKIKVKQQTKEKKKQLVI